MTQLRKTVQALLILAFIAAVVLFWVYRQPLDETGSGIVYSLQSWVKSIGRTITVHPFWQSYIGPAGNYWPLLIGAIPAVILASLFWISCYRTDSWLGKHFISRARIGDAVSYTHLTLPTILLV